MSRSRSHSMPLPPHRLPGRPLAWGRHARTVLALSAALLALVLGAAGGPVGATEPARGSVVVTAADDGRLLNLRQGDKLRVVLADIAGTGYSWEIEHNDPKLLAPEEQRSEQEPQPTPQRAGAPNGQPVPGVVGGPMRVSFQFRVVGKGKGELRLRHWRTWEGPGSIDRRFKLALQVVG